jgi:hypothetical protein
MLKKLILTAAAGTALVASSAFADNGWHRGWEHHHWHPYRGYVVVNPAPVVVSPYYAPAPVYSAPAPAYYPAPVYSAPAPAYYPAPVYAEPSVSVRFRLPL